MKGDIRRNASNNWVGREGAGCSQAEHSSLAAGRPSPVRRERGGSHSGAPPRVSLLSPAGVFLPCSPARVSLWPNSRLLWPSS